MLFVIECLSGKYLIFVEGDICNEVFIIEILYDYVIDIVIYFVGLKVVGELVVRLLEYYDNNVNGMLWLVSVMCVVNVKNFIFSFFVIVYGD